MTGLFKRKETTGMQTKERPGKDTVRGHPCTSQGESSGETNAADGS